MTSPALAIGWELWAKNRLGICVFAVLLVAVGALGAALPVGLAAGVIVPLSATLFFLAAIYLLAIVIRCEYDEGRLRLGLPARMYTLPVRTNVLVGWLMLYGLGALAALWLATVLVVWLPAGVEPAWWLLPLLGVAVVWSQAVVWGAPGPPVVKVAIACVIFPALKFLLELLAIAVLLFGYHEPRVDRETLVPTRPLVVTLFASCFIPLGYFAAVAGVSQARRGSDGAWGWVRDRLRRGWAVRRADPARRPAFRSPVQALMWFEWRRKGYVLPLFAAGFLLFLTAVVQPPAPPGALMGDVAILLGLVVVVAFFVGYGFGKTGFWGHNLDLSVFQAGHPVTSETLAFTRIGAAGLAALATTAAIAGWVTVWVSLAGQWGEVVGWASTQFPVLADISPVTPIALGVVVLIALTWGQLIGGMVPTLTGRGWVVNGVVTVYLTIVTGLGILVRHVVLHPEAMAPSVDAATWVIGCLIGAKLIAAAVAVRAATRRGLLTRRHILIILAVWSAAVGCVLAFVYQLLPANLRALTGAGVLFVPLVRVAAAPLALDWNRHR